MIFAVIMLLLAFMTIPFAFIAIIYKALGVFPTVAAKRAIRKEEEKKRHFEYMVSQKEKELRAQLKKQNEEQLILREALKRISKTP